MPSSRPRGPGPRARYGLRGAAVGDMSARVWELVVFDWDGTIMDSTGAIVRAAQRAIAELGLPERPPEAIREIIGLGLWESWESLFPGVGRTGFDAFVIAYRRHFVDRERHSIVPYPGARGAIERLSVQGRLLAVATVKSRRVLDHDFRDTGLGPLFHDSVTADEARSKPHPQMLLDLIRRLGVDPARTLMVGDTEFDLQMARDAGASAIGVSGGAHEEERLLGQSPLACLASVSELPTWLENSETELDQFPR